ncbi:hypothetical protein Poly51_48340 [Rubripirellula tenax]|uniref:Uncharacterized protein n=1 Tax=Rubripirellula tenax TaxID=2528015 RepID=A0A5C6EKB1_9BACT|nr:hypothetical protein Poly51_48340 [Rubripirellula tenax]
MKPIAFLLFALMPMMASAADFQPDESLVYKEAAVQTNNGTGVSETLRVGSCAGFGFDPKQAFDLLDSRPHFRVVD